MSDVPFEPESDNDRCDAADEIVSSEPSADRRKPIPVRIVDGEIVIVRSADEVELVESDALSKLRLSAEGLQNVTALGNLLGIPQDQVIDRLSSTHTYRPIQEVESDSDAPKLNSTDIRADDFKITSGTIEVPISRRVEDIRFSLDTSDDQGDRFDAVMDSLLARIEHTTAVQVFGADRAVAADSAAERIKETFSLGVTLGESNYRVMNRLVAAAQESRMFPLSLAWFGSDALQAMIDGAIEAGNEFRRFHRLAREAARKHPQRKAKRDTLAHYQRKGYRVPPPPAPHTSTRWKLSPEGKRLIARYPLLRETCPNVAFLNKIAALYFTAQSVAERNYYLSGLGLHEFRPMKRKG